MSALGVAGGPTGVLAGRREIASRWIPAGQRQRYERETL